MAPRITYTALAAALQHAVRSLDWMNVRDALSPTGTLTQFPNIDLAVVAFPPGSEPVAANVLFSREFPEGVVADIAPQAGSIRNIRFEQDQRDAAGTSIAWLPDCDWTQLKFQYLAGEGGHRFIAPYPASLVKVMVAVGTCMAVDSSSHRWDTPWTYQTHTRTIAAWAESMMVSSNNDATSAMVALLHAAGIVQGTGAGEVNQLNRLFERLGLSTLRLAGTQPDGGWRNADGAGVGQLHMTAWDTVRLLWLLRDDLPAPPWVAGGLLPLSATSRTRFWGWMQAQGLHEILSSTALAGVPGWQPGIPARLPARWVQADGSVRVEDISFPGDVRAANAASTALFAHKTGTTDNYASDAGFVSGTTAAGRRYLIALTTSLGRRYAPHAGCATDWRVPRLGALVDTWLAAHLE